MINVTDPNTFQLPASGAASINLADLGGVSAGDYVIIDYNGSPLADADVASKLLIATQIPGLSGSIVNDSANTQVKLHLEVVQQGPPQWAIATGGSWGVASNWSPAVVPGGTSGNNSIANLLGNLTAASGVIKLDGSRTVNQLNFNNAAHSYIISTGATESSTRSYSAGSCAL